MQVAEMLAGCWGNNFWLMIFMNRSIIPVIGTFLFFFSLDEKNAM
jgi:hypothetical protein